MHASDLPSARATTTQDPKIICVGVNYRMHAESPEWRRRMAPPSSAASRPASLA